MLGVAGDLLSIREPEVPVLGKPVSGASGLQSSACRGVPQWVSWLQIPASPHISDR